jgi:DNA-directed RNA polymerase specialized sigma24 family protein
MADPATDAARWLLEARAGSREALGRATAHEQEETLQRALAQLPEDYRRVLILRH